MSWAYLLTVIVEPTTTCSSNASLPAESFLDVKNKAVPFASSPIALAHFRFKDEDSAELNPPRLDTTMVTAVFAHTSSCSNLFRGVAR